MSSLSTALRTPYGPYPERLDVSRKTLDQHINRFLLTRPKRTKVIKRFPSLLDEINQIGLQLPALDESALQGRIKSYRQKLQQQGLTDAHVAEGFALVREVSHRTLGLRHHDCQLQGGWYMLNGMIAEMETGEGKTITATLPVSLMALAGFPTHVITVNDYLAERDAEILKPLYQAFGLEVGVVVSTTTHEEKQQAYNCDITHCTNKTLTFDYLRDRMTLENRNSSLRFDVEKLYRNDGGRHQKLLLRGLCFALLDEADSLLVDEARTPLVISGQGNSCQEEDYYRQAHELAIKLEEKQDFQIEKEQIILSDAGEEKLAQWGEELGGVWVGARRRRENISMALRAQHTLIRDQHYIVEDDKVVIIDEYTGRPMPDRFWGRGLQQLVEIKENCTVTGNRETLARISYQRFFRRYHHLAGMTGTAAEIGAELSDVYALPVLKVPSHRPSQRRFEKTTICENQQQKWRKVIDRINQLHALGRPLLIGTRTVEASEQLSEQLTALGMDHKLLNARQNEEEADVISAAGQYARITIATNMAGRGTDIALDDAALKAGGLHVILTEAHTAGRIDRQLYGRCARQGAPGSVEAIMALDDDVATVANSMLIRLLRQYPRALNSVVGQWLATVAIDGAQKRMERTHFKIRSKMLHHDKQTEDALAFSGHSE
ncbi:MAG: preprotein translocase subunit SecA [Pseudomonadales bacterium]|nr:preprotein translocase subunit SecA [Pseudomonadales bacterium]